MTKPTVEAFFSGVNFGYLCKRGYFGSEEGLAQPAAMKKAGVRWVSICVTVMQESFASTRLFRDFTYTPDDSELSRLIDAFHAVGIKVLLKPIIECWDSSWRGRITFPVADQQIQGVEFDYWQRWFDSMSLMLDYYARFAKAKGVEGFTIAQELYGADSQTEHWLRLTAQVRAIYSGLLVVNVDGRAIPPSPELTAWLKPLDAVGFSFYPELSAVTGDSVSEIREALQPHRDVFRSMAAEIGRPLYFAECGARSMRGGLSSTGEYRTVNAYDGQVQANYIDALLETFADEPWWIGFQLWKWDEQQHRPHYRQSEGDTGFTVMGKPAEAVLARWSQVFDAKVEKLRS